MLSAFLIVALLVVVLAALLVRRLALQFLRTRGRRTPRTPRDLGLEGEAFALPTRDGAVRGWLMRARGTPRALILFAHGWNSNAGDMLRWAAPLVAAGYDAMVYDTLGHGESDASEFTSIRHFRRDLLTVAAFARALPRAAPGLVLFGHSMGGAAAILAASEGAQARAVIVAGAPTDPLDITREWLDAKRLPGAMLTRLMLPFWRPIVRVPLASLRPVERIATLAVPVLILHGDGDRQVRVHHAEQLARASPGARLERFPAGDHLNLPDQSRYLEVVTGFLDDVLRARTDS
jgi:pimeloyl-ACP methyl ester carboxylesterase